MIYFKAKLTAEQPLIIGSGLDENTDNDILLGADGKPFIPGTTLAGVCRHYAKDKTAYGIGFGGRGNSGKGMPLSSANSKTIFYDAPLSESALDSFQITIRDMVRIGEDGTAMDGAKFDSEIIEVGASFDLRIEAESGGIISEILNGFSSGELKIGGKTTRGYGKVSVSEPKYIEIDPAKDLDEVINFKWSQFDCSQIVKPFELLEVDTGRYETLTLELKLKSFLFVRNYATTAPDPLNNGKLVDAEQLLGKNANGEEASIIPGTSIAGVFRHRFARVLRQTREIRGSTKEKDEETENLCFGFVKSKSPFKSKSKVIFSDIKLKGSILHNRTRTAIDRFTGGAGDKLLFTTRPAYGGTCELEIKIPIGLPQKELVKSILDACVKELNDGFISFGGESATGGGLFTVTKEGWA